MSGFDSLLLNVQVTEKNNDTKHDFFTDPIRLIRQGDWLKVRVPTERRMLQ